MLFFSGTNATISSPLHFLPNLRILNLAHNEFLTAEKLEAFLHPLKNRNLTTLILSLNSYIKVPFAAIEMVSC